MSLLRVILVKVGELSCWLKETCERGTIRYRGTVLTALDDSGAESHVCHDRLAHVCKDLAELLPALAPWGA